MKNLFNVKKSWRRQPWISVRGNIGFIAVSAALTGFQTDSSSVTGQTPLWRRLHLQTKRKYAFPLLLPPFFIMLCSVLAEKLGWAHWFTGELKSFPLSVSCSDFHPSASLTWTFTLFLPDFLRISSWVLMVSFWARMLPVQEASWPIQQDGAAPSPTCWRQNSVSGWDQTPEQDRRISTGRKEEEIEIWDKGKMEKRRIKEETKRARREMCWLWWIFPSSRFFCQVFSINLWGFEEIVCTVQSQPSLRCFVPGWRWSVSPAGTPFILACPSAPPAIDRYNHTAMAWWKGLNDGGESRNRSEEPKEGKRSRRLSAAIREGAAGLPFLRSFTDPDSMSGLVVANTKPDSFIRYRRVTEKGAFATLIHLNPVIICRRAYAYFPALRKYSTNASICTQTMRNVEVMKVPTGSHLPSRLDSSLL